MNNKKKHNDSLVCVGAHPPHSNIDSLLCLFRYISSIPSKTLTAGAVSRQNIIGRRIMTKRYNNIIRIMMRRIRRRRSRIFNYNMNITHFMGGYRIISLVYV